MFAPEKTLAQLCKDLTGILPIHNEDALHILKKKSESMLKNMIPASLVAWDGHPNIFHIQLEINSKNSLLKIESNNIQFKINNNNLDYSILNILKRKNRFTLQIKILTKIPIGYHDLDLFIDNNKSATSFLISAPSKLDVIYKKSWGPFIPTYALRSESDWGIGSFSELAAAAKLCQNYGANFISILPTLAGNFDFANCDPSPYSALSRFFWNEIYLDVDLLLHKYPSTEALQIRQSSEFKSELKKLRNLTHVDYYHCYKLKKTILLLLADHFFEHPLPNSYQEFLNKNPLAQAYASFRAKDFPNEKSRISNFHLFVQYETDLVLAELHKNLGLDLYMDYPVGVNDAGFDYTNEPSNFFGAVSVGAPPEPVFQLGQDWGFPAFHPQNLALKKYQYFIESIRQHLKYSKILRLDHVIGLYRIYSVPKGFGGKNGAYLRFPEEDFFAIVILEAEKEGADIIGENLGVVPKRVNEILEKRNLKGMQILEIALTENPENLTPKLNQNTLCALNTHDMPMFASFLKAQDLIQVRDLGILSAEFYPNFKIEREQQINNWSSVFQKNPILGALKYLASSNCRYLVVNPEDLWGEEHPQNIPGTWKEVPNWRRKMALPIEHWEKHETTHQALILLKKHFC